MQIWKIHPLSLHPIHPLSHPSLPLLFHLFNVRAAMLVKKYGIYYCRFRDVLGRMHVILKNAAIIIIVVVESLSH
jgi:hypothetical protein